MASNALKSRNRLIARKRAFNARLDLMSDNEVAREISHLEDSDPRTGTFNAWALSSAIAELDNRI